ncbi:DUF4468 domain-containing protein [Sphingobacterium spiritivorum]
MRNGEIYFEEVVEINRNQKELFKNAKMFFAKAFNSSKNVINNEDPEAGIIIGNAGFNIYPKYMGSSYEQFVNFTIQLDIRNDKYRYKIYGFHTKLHNLDDLNGYADGSIKNMKNTKRYATRQIAEISQKTQSLITQLKTEMSNSDEF